MAISNIERIQLDEHKELKNAERLNEVAGRLIQNTRGLEQLESLMSDKWKGTTATIYISKMDRVEKEIGMHARDIREMAEQLKTIVARKKKTEEQAISIAQEKNYK